MCILIMFWLMDKGALLQSPGPQKPQPESCEHTTAPSLFAS